MDNSVQSQIYIFLSTLYGGIIIGFVYDIYRIFRYFFRPKKVAAFIEDLIFWIVVSLISLFILLFSSWGEIRGYDFIGFICGAILYSKLLSRAVITLLVNIVKGILYVLKFLIGIILFPFKLIGRILYRPYRKAVEKADKGYRKAKRIAKLPLRLGQDLKRYGRTILKKK